MGLLGLAHRNLPAATLQLSFPFCWLETDHGPEVRDKDGAVGRHQEPESLDQCLEDLLIGNITSGIHVGNIPTSVVFEAVYVSGFACYSS